MPSHRYTFLRGTALVERLYPLASLSLSLSLSLSWPSFPTTNDPVKSYTLTTGIVYHARRETRRCEGANIRISLSLLAVLPHGQRPVKSYILTTGIVFNTRRETGVVSGTLTLD